MKSFQEAEKAETPQNCGVNRIQGKKAVKRPCAGDWWVEYDEI